MNILFIQIKIFYFREDPRKDVNSILNLRGNNYFLPNLRLTNEDTLVLYHTLKSNSYITHLDLRFDQKLMLNFFL